MTEAEARAALRTFVGVGDIEPWIAEQPWKAEPGGWSVPGELQATNRDRFRGWAKRQPGLRCKFIRGREYVSGLGLRPLQGGDG